jgi:hypothetical protein
MQKRIETEERRRRVTDRQTETKFDNLYNKDSSFVRKQRRRSAIMVCEASETREKPKKTRSEQRKDKPRKKTILATFVQTLFLSKLLRRGVTTTGVQLPSQQEQKQQQRRQQRQQQQPQRGSDDGRRRRLGGDEGHILCRTVA